MQYKIKAGGNLTTNVSRFTGLLFTLWITQSVVVIVVILASKKYNILH